MSNQRYILLTFVVAAITMVVAIASAGVELLAATGLPDAELVGVNASSLIGVACGIATFVILLRNTRAVTFVDEVVVELRKVYWPKREETVNSTTVVVVATMSLAAAIAIYDFVWAKITSAFLYS